MKKKKGNLLLFSTSFFAILFIIILVMFSFMLYSLNAQNDIVRDSLTSTNLSVFSGLDLETLGKDDKTKIIKDPIKALNIYKKHLKNNLQLDSNYKSKNKVSFIKDEVKITKFIIYNVIENDVYVYEANPNSNSFSTNKIYLGKGKVKTPRGNIVDETTVHSEISFSINQMFKNKEMVTMSEDTDIFKD